MKINVEKWDRWIWSKVIYIEIPIKSIPVFANIRIKSIKACIKLICVLIAIILGIIINIKFSGNIWYGYLPIAATVIYTFFIVTVL